MPHSSRADRSAVTSPTAAELRWPTSMCPPKPRRVAGPVAVASTDANGNYTIIGLPAGNYQVQFTAPSGSGLVSEYYDNTTNSSTATPVAVTARPGDERDRCLTRPGRIDHRSRHQQQRSWAGQRECVRPNRAVLRGRCESPAPMPTGTTRSAVCPPATTRCSSRRLSAAGWSVSTTTTPPTRRPRRRSPSPSAR